MYLKYFCCIFIIFPLWKTSLIFVYVIVYCGGAGITTLMPISDRLDPYLFRRKMERTWSVEENMVWEVFISRQDRHFSIYR